jgi:hypothetical protein
MLVGFVLGGLGLMFGPMWAVFWVGVAIVAVGGVLALAVGIFSDVVVYDPRDISRLEEGAPGGTDAVETQAVKSESAEDASHA